jgi:hypothetical protein
MGRGLARKSPDCASPSVADFLPDQVGAGGVLALHFRNATNRAPTHAKSPHCSLSTNATCVYFLPRVVINSTILFRNNRSIPF